MAEDQEYWSEEEVIAHLKRTKAAIEEGLANLGVEDDDDVSGFSLESFQVFAPKAPPQLAARLGPRFNPVVPTDLAAANGHCGFIC